MTCFHQQTATQVSVCSILANVFLSAIKLFAGFFAQSTAMISDAVHSLSDVFSTVVVIIGVKMAAQAPDKDHPYGHERLECVAAILLAGLLCVTGLAIGYAGVQKIMHADEQPLMIPGALALAAAIISILLKEGMYWYTRTAAKRLSSSALMADAWHHRSDALSSIGSFIGILGARAGFLILDPLAGIVISVVIIKVSVDIFLDAVSKMTDRSSDDSMIQAIHEVIAKQENVLGVDQIKTRMFGDRIYVDVEISANGESSLNETHEIAERVHDAIEEEFPQVKHCMVHVNPECLEKS
ncbi:MAG: cation diffusion facilitator family transporter [Clostridiales bacterium]|nr:cation diffusion facilitator family transporter [Clostridiales bacterium]